jgi:hypothetical protein
MIYHRNAFLEVLSSLAVVGGSFRCHQLKGKNLKLLPRCMMTSVTPAATTMSHLPMLTKRFTSTNLENDIHASSNIMDVVEEKRDRYIEIPKVFEGDVRGKVPEPFFLFFEKIMHHSRLKRLTKPKRIPPGMKVIYDVYDTQIVFCNDVIDKLFLTDQHHHDSIYAVSDPSDPHRFFVAVKIPS